MSSERAPMSSTLTCTRCSYIWIPRKSELPKRCPKCRSIKWNDHDLKVACLRCGHVWNSHNGSPKRCPSCGTHQWNVAPKEYSCKRCGYNWVSKGRKQPKRCPMCTSRGWSTDSDPPNSRASRNETDREFEDFVMKEYRRGCSCVDISISNNLPYSKVYSVVRRTLATINIKV